MPPLRPRPDIDETREMLRQHDERVEEEEEREAPSEDAESGKGDEEEPETPQ